MSFEKALDFTLGWECGRNRDGSLKDGYVWHPDDPGGETKFGISKGQYPDLDIKNLTLAEAIAIYERDYWKFWGCDKLPAPLSFVAFDTYVQFSVSTAQRLLKDIKDWRDVMSRRKEFRGERVRKHPPSQAFLNGWLARDNDLHKLCTIWEQDHA